MTHINFSKSPHSACVNLYKHDMEKNPTPVVKTNHALSPFLWTFVMCKGEKY